MQFYVLLKDWMEGEIAKGPKEKATEILLEVGDQKRNQKDQSEDEQNKRDV